MTEVIFYLYRCRIHQTLDVIKGIRQFLTRFCRIIVRSSFAFIAPAGLVIKDMGYQYALGGFVITGLIFCIVAIIIKFAGTSWINTILPPAAMGPVVALIGLELAKTAALNRGVIINEDAGYKELDEPSH